MGVRHRQIWQSMWRHVLPLITQLLVLLLVHGQVKRLQLDLLCFEVNSTPSLE